MSSRQKQENPGRQARSRREKPADAGLVTEDELEQGHYTSRRRSVAGVVKTQLLRLLNGDVEVAEKTKTKTGG